MTAEEKGIFPQVFLVMIFRFTSFNTKIQQVLYMCPNLSSSVFITFHASLGTLWKHTCTSGREAVLNLLRGESLYEKKVINPIK